MVFLPEIDISSDTLLSTISSNNRHHRQKKGMKHQSSKMPHMDGLTVYMNLVQRLKHDRFFAHVPLRSVASSPNDMGHHTSRDHSTIMVGDDGDNIITIETLKLRDSPCSPPDDKWSDLRYGLNDSQC